MGYNKTTGGIPEAEILPGGSHDNDFGDFTRIRLYPTQEEILCEQPIFLPKNRPDYVPPHLPHPTVKEHLDLHFRLLRHDVVFPLKLSVQDFVYYGMKKVKNGRFICPTAKDAPNLVVYENVRLVDIDARPRWITFDISFTDNNPKKKQKEFWEHSKQLMVGSLVCLCYTTSASKNPHLAFAVVKKRPFDNAWAGEFKNKLVVGLAACGDGKTQDIQDTQL
eukprot:TRINITY_DN5058_c0_g3_i5.p1 TRINITY_DN5058_c0_g3~~TRINITY_DN5058_c0_g3_i5.p1  ORF type:complete len:221 (-),score=41.44 TRINITY_DN5058_c0_g3_i5:260-922(-)